MNEVVLGSLSFSAARFEDEPAFSDGHEEWMDCVATLSSDGDATEVPVTMIKPYRCDMLGFFDELASMPENWLSRASWHSENGEVLLDAMGLGNGAVTIFAALAWWTQWGYEQKKAAFSVPTSEVKAFATSLAPFLRIPYGQGTNLGTRWSFTDHHDVRPKR